MRPTATAGLGTASAWPVFRAALACPTYFGPGGVVQRSVTTVTMGSVDAASLAGLNLLIATGNADADMSPSQLVAVKAFFPSGGDLFWLQDDSGHDPIGELPGLTTTNGSGRVSNGGAPVYDGPFGKAKDAAQNYNVGPMDEAAMLALNGKVAARNTDGQAKSACWKAGQFAPGAGALFINADIDMIATTTFCGVAICGANDNPLNDNGIFALNTFAFLQDQGGTPPVPEPGTYGLMALGLAGIALATRRLRKG